MNAALYFLCLILLLLIAAMATFGLLIGSLVNFGIWGVFKALAAPLYDPFGREFWMILLLLNPFGFCAIAAIGILVRRLRRESLSERLGPRIGAFVHPWHGQHRAQYLVAGSRKLDQNRQLPTRNERE
ncbi:MAG: hypothetical protein EXQ52_18080 [Bryobacterales bacterium]|nr:hypothetical protein [Bryobacterales bacterium]